MEKSGIANNELEPPESFETDPPTSVTHNFTAAGMFYTQFSHYRAPVTFVVHFFHALLYCTIITYVL